MSESWKKSQRLIVTIVKKGKAKKICEAAKCTGAEGGTTIMGKGTSIKAFKKLFGITLDEDREVVFTITSSDLEDKIFNEIIEKGELNKPGKGIVFVMDLKKVEGIVHLLKGAQVESD